MAQLLGTSTPPLKRRLFGLDPRAVDAVLQAAAREQAQLEQQLAEARSSEASVERMGGEIADMLRSFAESALTARDHADRRATEILEGARAEAVRLREEAEGTLTSAREEAQRLVADSAALARALHEETLHATRLRLDEVADGRQRILGDLGAVGDQMRLLLATVEAIELPRLEALTDQEVGAAAQDALGDLAAEPGDGPDPAGSEADEGVDEPSGAGIRLDETAEEALPDAWMVESEPAGSGRAGHRSLRSIHLNDDHVIPGSPD